MQSRKIVFLVSLTAFLVFLFGSLAESITLKNGTATTQSNNYFSINQGQESLVPAASDAQSMLNFYVTSSIILSLIIFFIWRISKRKKDKYLIQKEKDSLLSFLVALMVLILIILAPVSLRYMVMNVAFVSSIEPLIELLILVLFLSVVSILLVKFRFSFFSGNSEVKMVRYEETQEQVVKKSEQIYYSHNLTDLRSNVVEYFRVFCDLVQSKLNIDTSRYTARELETIANKELRINDIPLSRLRAVFEKARYSNQDPTPDEAKQAMECLNKILDQAKIEL